MVKDNKDQEDVIVAFNGKNHKLKDWTREEKAATDDDPSLNWKKVFEEHTPRPNLGESAPTGFVPYKKVKKKRKNIAGNSIVPLIKQFWIPFLSAIIVGLGIGFTVLIMFSHHKDVKKEALPADAPVSQQKPSDVVAKSLSGGDFAVSLQVVQGGSYGTQKAANERLDELKKLQVPAAVFREDDQYKVLIGVAASESVRREMTDAFTNVKDLYGKSWAYQPKTIKTSNQVADFLKIGKQLFDALVPLSAAKTLDQKVDKKALSDIGKNLNKWPGIDTLNVKGSLKSDLTSFRGAVEAALSHLENTDDPDNAQQSLLDAISTYQKILIALSV